MAGHSQFKNIMYRKGAQDAKRARLFNKLIREITVSARSGLPDPAANPRLRTALAAARAANMPKDNVDRALKKALGGDDGVNYEEVRYEGYGPSGVAIIVETLTDNRNRTAAEIRSSFNKLGGSLGEIGSVSFMFEHIGMISLPTTVTTFDDIFEAAVDAGALNVEEVETTFDVSTSLEDFAHVRDSLISRFGDVLLAAKLIWRPLNLVPCNLDAAPGLLRLMDVLEDNDDVQNVFANFDIPEEVLTKLAEV
ncbi:MAG: YebC/PmpR family DNA-binding transcriptional regulator [Alphaproteobacteria bacterium]